MCDATLLLRSVALLDRSKVESASDVAVASSKYGFFFCVCQLTAHPHVSITGLRTVTPHVAGSPMRTAIEAGETGQQRVEPMSHHVFAAAWPYAVTLLARLLR